MFSQIHELVTWSAKRAPDSPALTYKNATLSYAELAQAIDSAATGLLNLGLQPAQRVAVYLPKQVETVVGLLATSKAGGAFVPVNPILKGPQVKYILNDCSVQILVTSKARFGQIQSDLDGCPDLKHVILVDGDSKPGAQYQCHDFSELDASPAVFHRRIDQDLAAILYTSGSTGNPKGVALSHRNLIAGAQSVAQYLGNNSNDRILAVLPLSFDAGLSQLTTAFLSGAQAIIMDYLLPRDVIRQIAKHKITGLTAVPPLWVQLAQLDWPKEASESIRYFANTGGAMPQATLQALRERMPKADPFLMYGLTEAFRSTYLDPSEVDRRPDSMGKAIPNAQIMVLREDGTECDDDEPGELVHRGVHVSLGYWNAPEKTAVRFKPVADSLGGQLLTEMAVWSGDTVRRDKDGFLYFIGRKDDMIKSSGYRISPSEIEDLVYNHPNVSEVAALGIPHDALGQAVVLVVKPADVDTFEESELLSFCKKAMPNFMHPQAIKIHDALPRNANGKIDRKQLWQFYQQLFTES